ncbi:MAG TPA: hypothetical protein VI485_21645 [Vicinamibacterales bacterium]|nr:hypothetical protein [Vicinamibacterales bacterium]
MSLPLDVRLALAPLGTYRELAGLRVAGTWTRALERPAFVALLTGTLTAMSATGRVTLGLVLAGALCWSFAPALQMLAGAIIIRSAPGRSVGMVRVLELLFIGHLPWSLWLLVVFGLFTFSTLPLSLTVVILSVIIPTVWTMRIVFAFCTTALGIDRRGAQIRTVVHQAIIWTFVLVYLFLVSGLVPRALALVGR